MKVALIGKHFGTEAEAAVALSKINK